MMMAHRRASLTIEAAMVLPVFIFALLTLVSLISMKQKAMDIQEEMFMEAASIAVNETAGPEYRELSVKRELFPMIRMFGPLSVNVERKCLFHVWNGYGGGYFPDDEIVYVTEGSEVYHRDRNCSHLKLTVTKTQGALIPSLRNAYGSRYKPCEICHSKLSDSNLYITPDGDRYHNSASCGALKRTVYAVRLREIKDKRPCSRCGR